MQKIEKVLVIDDDATCIYITLRVLQSLSEGNQAQTARNGLEGLALIQIALEQVQLPDLVLVDIKMPLMNGFAFIEELERLEKINFRDTRIVLLSSFHDPWVQERTFRKSVTAFLQKPLTKEKLLPFVN